MKNKGMVLVSSDFPSEMKNCLVSDGWEAVNVPFCDQVMPSIGGHPELQVFVIDQQEIIVHPDIPNSFLETIKRKFSRIIVGNKHLSKEYPYDIAYNGKIIGDTFFHKLENTDPILLKSLTLAGYEFADVNQGYSGCSILNIGNEALITADAGIAQSADILGFDVLLITPGSIDLHGLNYGFIGGACAWDGLETVYFCGNVKHHPDGAKITEFIHQFGYKTVNLSENRLTDYGSLLFIANNHSIL